MESLIASCVLATVAGYLSNRLILEFIPVFLQRRMYGVDRCKKSGDNVAEPMGVITSAVYLIVLSMFLPIPFYRYFHYGDPEHFPYHNFVEFLSGFSSICCMIFLGFADDVLDLRWRHKLMFPTLASIPLLVVYWANFNSTTIIVPTQLKPFIGTGDLNIGLFHTTIPNLLAGRLFLKRMNKPMTNWEPITTGFVYYIYMGMMAVFCTNAINILAGINGLEAGQSLVIALSVIVFNIVQLYRLETQDWYHYLSIYFLMPYVTTTAVLLKFNWYPAQVFVGDTFCYFSGMTLAVAGILGHFTKTMMLFFVPQIINFVYSCPQLFRLIPCPRHRLPRYDSRTDKMMISVTTFKLSELHPLGRLIVYVLSAVGLLHRRTIKDNTNTVDTEINNMTLINLVIKLKGPTHERELTKILLVIQVVCSVFAFLVRFWLAALVYDQVM